MKAGAVAASAGLTLAFVTRPGESDRLAADIAFLPGLLLAAGQGNADIVVLGQGAGTFETTAAAARGRGAAVILEAPDDLRGLARAEAGGGRLYAPGRIAHTEVGKHVVARLAGAGVGTVHSLFVAIRGAASGAGIAFEPLLWDAVCLVDDCLDEPLTGLHVEGGALFGTRPDTAVAIGRTASGTVVTIEVSLCLPPGLAPSGTAEVELEIMGGEATLRATPYSRCVATRTDRGGGEHFWGELPLVSMIEGWIAGDRPDAARMRRRLDTALAVLDALAAQLDDRPGKETART